MFKLSERSKERRAGVDPRLMTICDRALEISTIDFGIPADGGIRTAERQNELFRADASNADGYTHPSYHQSGLALDFYAYVDGKASWEPIHLAMVAAAFLQAAAELGHALKWGGLWHNPVDMPHVELKR